MDNMQSIINKHNKKVTSIDTKPNPKDNATAAIKINALLTITA